MNLNTAKPQWAINFKIDDSTWENLCSQADLEHITPLDLALESGLLNENKLIQWDRDISGLASLKAVFFNADPPKEIWETLDYARCRAAACMPIASWDGIVYWAKLSSLPTGLEEEHPNAVWVLAPWTGMKKWFGQWKAMVNLIAVDAPAGLSVPTEIKTETTTTTAAIAVATPAPQEAQTEDYLAPVGFNTSVTHVQVDFGAIQVGDSHDAGEPTLAKPLPPPPPTVEAAAAKKRSLDEPLDIDLTFSGDKSQAEATPLPSMAAAEPVLAPLPKVEPTLAPLPKHESGLIDTIITTVAPHNSGQPISFELSAPVLQPLTDAAASVPPPPPPPEVVEAVESATPAAAVPVAELENRLKLAPNQDVMAQVLMAAWQNYFDRVMICLFQKDRLMIWWQAGQWKGTPARSVEIPLNTPSIFKIVADTARPYHGYVSAGPVNDQFFQKTNGGEYPDHVTVVPILMSDKVVAMVFGGCSKEVGQNLAIGKLEDHARLFAIRLTQIMAPEKKAS